MPVVVLEVKAELENVRRMRVREGNVWCLSVRHPQAGDDGGDPDLVRERVTVDPAEEEAELEGSRGTANFVVRFAGERKQAYLKLLPDHECSTGVYLGGGGTEDEEDDDAGAEGAPAAFQPIMAFEVRGLDVFDFFPSDDFVVTASSGTEFEDVDLSERDWADYDEDADASVSVTELEFRFVTPADSKRK